MAGLVKGERKRPVPSIKGATPRERRLPKVPQPKVDQDELEKQSGIYLHERNAAMRLKRMAAEIQLARIRGQLIEKELATKQLLYFLIPFRQAALALPQKMHARFGSQVFTREMAHHLERCVHEMLRALSELPSAAEPDWLERLEEE